MGFEMSQYISTILVTNWQNLVKLISTIYFPYSSLILYTNSDITRLPPLGILFAIFFNKLMFPKLVSAYGIFVSRIRSHSK